MYSLMLSPFLFLIVMSGMYIPLLSIRYLINPVLRCYTATKSGVHPSLFLAFNIFLYALLLKFRRILTKYKLRLAC